MELVGRHSIAGGFPDEIQGVAELSRSLEGEVPRCTHNCVGSSPRSCRYSEGGSRLEAVQFVAVLVASQTIGSRPSRKAELSDRFELFTGGKWESLHWCGDQGHHSEQGAESPK